MTAGGAALTAAGAALTAAGDLLAAGWMLMVGWKRPAGAASCSTLYVADTSSKTTPTERAANVMAAVTRSADLDPEQDGPAAAGAAAAAMYTYPIHAQQHLKKLRTMEMGRAFARTCAAEGAPQPIDRPALS